MSSTENLYLKFRSDGSISKKGFKLSYEATSGMFHDDIVYILFNLLSYIRITICWQITRHHNSLSRFFDQSQIGFLSF